MRDVSDLMALLLRACYFAAKLKRLKPGSLKPLKPIPPRKNPNTNKVL
jgi:hypothetical protein